MFRRVRVAGLFAALVVLLGACDWPMFRDGPNHPGSTPDASIAEAAVSSSMVLDWVAASDSSVLLDDRVVYATVGNNAVAYDATGTVHCSGSPTTCSPLWTYPGSLYALTVANGLLYTSKSTVFDAAGNANCSGSPKSCSPLWTYTTDPTGFNQVELGRTVANGLVYGVNATHGSINHFVAFDANGNTNCSGTPKLCLPLWQTTSTVGGTEAVASGVLYVHGGDGNLYAFDASGSTNCSGTPKTCAPLWTAAVPIGSFSFTDTPAVVDGIVYVASGDALEAFDAAGNANCAGTPKTCTPLWSYPVGTSQYGGSPAIANGMVYVHTISNGSLLAFDATGHTNCSGTPKTCSPLWSAPVPDFLVTSPSVANGIVYVRGEPQRSQQPVQRDGIRRRRQRQLFGNTQDLHAAVELEHW